MDGQDLVDTDELEFRDAAANATAAGRLRRNATNITWHDGTAARNLVTSASIAGSNPSKPFEARLTLTTAVPVTTADVTAATTVYLTPYKGDKIALYDGTNWNIHTLTEISVAVPATTATMYDVFVYDVAGTLTLDATAWTNDTTRATALATQNGVLVKTGATGRRYVGSFRTTGVSGQTEDSLVKRYVWNYYNRVVRPMRVTETTDTWTYTTATFRQANANTANQLDFIIGVSEDVVFATTNASVRSDTVGVHLVSAIGLDSTSATATGLIFPWFTAVIANLYGYTISSWRGFPGIGRHFLAWLEYSQAAGTTTWAGDAAEPTTNQSGISGELLG